MLLCPSACRFCSVQKARLHLFAMRPMEKKLQCQNPFREGRCKRAPVPTSQWAGSPSNAGASMGWETLPRHRAGEHSTQKQAKPQSPSIVRAVQGMGADPQVAQRCHLTPGTPGITQTPHKPQPTKNHRSTAWFGRERTQTARSSKALLWAGCHPPAQVAPVPIRPGFPQHPQHGGSSGFGLSVRSQTRSGGSACGRLRSQREWRRRKRAAAEGESASQAALAQLGHVRRQNGSMHGPPVL